MCKPSKPFHDPNRVVVLEYFYDREWGLKDCVCVCVCVKSLKLLCVHVVLWFEAEMPPYAHLVCPRMV